MLWSIYANYIETSLKMTNSTNQEFHIPFLKSLVFLALVTIVSMVSARYFVFYTLSHSSKTPVYISSESQSLTD